MKYKSLLITTILLTIVTIAFYYNEVNPIIENNKNTNNFSTSTLSINLETTAGSGVYEEATNSLWPSEGYTFNAELSKCENGSELSWDESNKKVIVSSNKSDKCYVYFDKEPETFANHIISLYTTQGSNNLYHHDGTLENGINDGSYRYAGSYETTNNWVCYGTNSEICDDEHLYRIIGVFNENVIGEDGNATGETEVRVKLIKAYEGTQTSLGTAPHENDSAYKNATYYKGKFDAIPTYYWSGSSSNQSNNWITSTLNTNILNGTYLTTLGINWADKIAMSEWKVGGNIWPYIGNQTIAMVYQNEVVNPATDIVSNPKYNTKIGLMYASDYGFAASPANWSTTLSSYNNDINRNNNWLFMGINEWTILPCTATSRGAFFLSYDGIVSSNSVYNFSGIRPTFYLNSNVLLAGGSGTSTNPYRIA